MERRKFMTHAVLGAVALPSAYDFAVKLSEGPNSTRFGVDKKRTAETLRELAAHIESGHFILQSGGVYTQAQQENYTMTVLNLKFHERSE